MTEKNSNKDPAILGSIGSVITIFCIPIIIILQHQFIVIVPIVIFFTGLTLSIKALLQYRKNIRLLLGDE